jgi:hypothetical protein
MATAGYSGTPLLKKLGIREGMKVLPLHPPDNYYSLLEADISHMLPLKKETPDLVHGFVKNTAGFEALMKNINSFIQQNNKIIIWISWYKKSSGIKTDITEDVIRDYALKHDLVDVKVCAVSDIWSGLKLVVPLNKRK